MDKPTPRVNSALLANYGGKIVRITGQVVSFDDTQATLEASDKGQVTVKLSRDTAFTDRFYEVIGRVNPSDHSITELTSVSLGDNIDMNVVEQTVQIWQKHPDLFSEL